MPFNFYLKPDFLEKSLKCVIIAFYLDQAFWEFWDSCTFSAVCKKRLANKSFDFLGIEKEYDKEFSINNLV